MARVDHLRRRAVAIGGLAISLVVLVVSMELELARELLARGIARSSVYWDRNRGLAYAWAIPIAIPGLAVYAAVLWWALRTRFSIARLVALHAFTLVVTLAAFHTFGMFGIPIGTASGSIGALALLRTIGSPPLSKYLGGMRNGMS